MATLQVDSINTKIINLCTLGHAVKFQVPNPELYVFTFITCQY